jgi:hypothetical protein
MCKNIKGNFIKLIKFFILTKYEKDNNGERKNFFEDNIVEMF